MKKLLSILLALMLMVSGTALAEAAEEAKGPGAGTALGFELLRALSDGSENQVISPISLAYALGMAAEGAGGETRQELLGALGVENTGELRVVMDALAAAGMKQANAAFIVGEFVPEESYVQALRDRFDAQWFEDSGDLVGDVNAWVAEHTDGLIEKMLDEAPDPETVLALVNAISMDAKWLARFDPADTRDDVFHAPDGDVTVPFMHNELWADYAERDGVQLLRLGYRDDDYAPSGLTMLIALPGEDGVQPVLDGLCEEGLGYFAFEGEQSRVKLSMPRTDISADNGLTDALQMLGVEKAFSDGADFSGISKETPLKIGAVLQKARLMLDEEGTKAAAATVVEIDAMSAYNPEMVVEFNMNRPFALVIADEAADAVCFAGIVANPMSN